MSAVQMLLDAADTVRERGETYGDPRVNMQRTAALWSVVLGTPVTPGQVALCLVMLKAARLVQSPAHVDSILDIAGYAAVMREVTE